MLRDGGSSAAAASARSGRGAAALLRIRAVLEAVDPLVDWRGVAAPPITRLNERYASALALAELILAARLGERRESGDVRSTTFVFDMNKVFEDFVTAAFRESMRRHGGDGARPGEGVLAGRRQALDAQARPELVERRQRASRSSTRSTRRSTTASCATDAYQMLAYCTAYGLRRGYLVYAHDSGEQARTHRVRHSGHEIIVATLDVGKQPADLLADVAALADRVVSDSRPR